MPTLASQRPVGCRTTPLWLEEPRLKPLLCRRTAITRSVMGMCSMVSITSSYLQYSKVRGRYIRGRGGAEVQVRVVEGG